MINKPRSKTLDHFSPESETVPPGATLAEYHLPVAARRLRAGRAGTTIGDLTTVGGAVGRHWGKSAPVAAGFQFDTMTPGVGMEDGSSLRRLAHWLFPALVIAALFAPFALTDRPFFVDASNQLWLIAQRQHLSGGWASYFLSSDRTGLFYPIFAFYGGTTFSAFGSLAAWLGDLMVVDALSWLMPFVLAYGGLTWISRQAGIRGWRAQIAGLVYVSSAYFLTNIYGRGAWAETIATSAIPMVVAAGFWLVRRDVWRWPPMAAFVLSSVIFIGSHNVTLLYGSIFLGLVACIAVWAFWPEVRSAVKLRIVGRLALLAALSAGITMAFLLPGVVYASQTAIGTKKQPFAFTQGSWFQIVFEPLFYPLRMVPKGSSTPSLYQQLPVILLLWLVAFGVLVVARRDRLQQPLRRFFLALSLLGLCILFLMLWDEPWRHLPKIATLIQFSGRLQTYVLFVFSGLVIIALRVFETPLTDLKTARGRRARRQSPCVPAWIASLTMILALGFGLGVWQVWASESWSAHRADALTPLGFAPNSWYDAGSYNDVSQPVVQVAPDRRVDLDARLEDGGEFHQVIDLPPGYQPIATNIAASPDLINVRGVLPIGRTGGVTGKCNLCGFPTMVIRRPARHPTGPVKITITGASPWPVVMGRMLSLASLVATTAWIFAVGVGGIRRRPAASSRRRPSGSGADHDR